MNDVSELQEINWSKPPQPMGPDYTARIYGLLVIVLVAIPLLRMALRFLVAYDLHWF